MFFKDYSSFWKGFYDLIFNEGYKIGKKFAKEEFKTHKKLCGSNDDFRENYLGNDDFDYDTFDSPFRFFFYLLYYLEDLDDFEYGGEFAKNMNRDIEEAMLDGGYKGYCDFWDKYCSKIKTTGYNIIEDD